MVTQRATAADRGEGEVSGSGVFDCCNGLSIAG